MAGNQKEPFLCFSTNKNSIAKSYTAYTVNHETEMLDKKTQDTKNINVEQNAMHKIKK